MTLHESHDLFKRRRILDRIRTRIEEIRKDNDDNRQKMLVGWGDQCWQVQYAKGWSDACRVILSIVSEEEKRNYEAVLDLIAKEERRMYESRDKLQEALNRLEEEIKIRENRRNENER